MLLKKGTVILVTSNEAPLELSIDGEKVRTYPKGSLIFNKDADRTIKLVEKGEIINDEHGYTRAHLLLVVSAIPKKGDMVLKGEEPEEVTEDGNEEALIVVASTNRIHGLPKFSKNFLERYVEQGINEVFVVYEEVMKPVNEMEDLIPVFIPKVNRGGFISLRKTKEIYNKQEVKALITEALNTFGKKTTKKKDIDKWIAEHV